MKNKQMEKWVNDHKTELTVIATLTGGAALCFIAYKYRMQLPKTNVDVKKVVVESTKVVEEVVKAVPNEILSNLTGNMKTATELGNKVLCSAQDINKRLLAADLCVKLPNGEYRLTKEGMKLGNLTCKTTFYGHDFTNIEWDEIVLNYIFSPEELNHVNELKAAYAKFNTVN